MMRNIKSFCSIRYSDVQELSRQLSVSLFWIEVKQRDFPLLFCDLEPIGLHVDINRPIIN